MVVLVDCHCHLTSDQFQDDLDAVLARAWASGVRIILACSTTQSDMLRVIQLRQERPDMVLACLGLHPLAGAYREESWSEVRNLIISEHEQRGLAAIGEIGLDFSRTILREQAKAKNTSEAEVKATQVAAFEAQVALALELGIPVNVHSRNAERHTLEILKRTGVRGVMHAYKNDASLAAEAAKSGRLFFSFPPSLVYKWEYQEAVKALPLEVLLLETDSPSLAAGGPKQRNEPGFIHLAASKMAELKGVTVETIAKVTTENARTLFGSAEHSLLSSLRESKPDPVIANKKTQRWRTKFGNAAASRPEGVVKQHVDETPLASSHAHSFPTLGVQLATPPPHDFGSDEQGPQTRNRPRRWASHKSASLDPTLCSGAYGSASCS